MNKNLSLVLMFALLGLALSGCGGRSPASKYYVLNSDIPAPSTMKLTGKREVSLYKVEIPAYLDRGSVITRDPNGAMLVVSDFNLWAEPLDKGVRRILGEAIGPVMLKNGAVLLAPGDTAQSAAIRVYIDIQRLDAALNGEAVLESSFTVRDRDENVLGRGFFAEKEQAGQNYESMVAAESRLLVKFGQAIAAGIVESFPGGTKTLRK